MEPLNPSVLLLELEEVKVNMMNVLASLGKPSKLNPLLRLGTVCQILTPPNKLGKVKKFGLIIVFMPFLPFPPHAPCSSFEDLT